MSDPRHSVDSIHEVCRVLAMRADDPAQREALRAAMLADPLCQPSHAESVRLASSLASETSSALRIVGLDAFGRGYLAGLKAARAEKGEGP